MTAGNINILCLLCALLALTDLLNYLCFKIACTLSSRYKSHAPFCLSMVYRGVFFLKKMAQNFYKNVTG